MMRIHIEQIPEQGLNLDLAEKADGFPVLANMVKNGDCVFLSPINTTFRAIRIGDMIEVEGRLTTAAGLTCGRCLTQFNTTLDTEFTLTYTRFIPGTEEDSEQAEMQLHAEDMGLIHFQGDEIDLRDGIQEQVVLALPLRAICKENCKGLCPICGVNWNDGNCDCSQDSTENRFAVLKNLNLK